MQAAIHEVGHAWAYQRQGRSIRYITLRPRTSDCSGLTAVRRRRVTPTALGFTAIAGPIAEACWTAQNDDLGLDWVDYLNGVLFSGGSDDLIKIPDYLLNNDEWVAWVRAEVEADWDAIVGLAERLEQDRTIVGPVVVSHFGKRS